MAETKRKYAHDGVYEYNGRKSYVRAWKEGRGRQQEIMVQVWINGNPDGEPQGDWAMPGIIGLEGAIEQSILQTKR